MELYGPDYSVLLCGHKVSRKRSIELTVPFPLGRASATDHEPKILAETRKYRLAVRHTARFARFRLAGKAGGG
jgi:hypothetical protein